MAEAYPKILESDDGWLLEPGELRRLAREPWVVCEKVHGANLSFVVQPSGITLHKRKGPVARGEDFFGAARVLARHESGLDALATRALAEHGGREVQLFGELYGGRYPHPDVPPVEGVQPIQTGIHYCPGVAFVAFDLALLEAEGARFVGYDRLRALCASCGIPVVQPLARGSLSQALAFPLGFDSTFPALHGLPRLAGPNPAEGVVVRPAAEVLVPTAKGPRRALLKRKLAAFAEDARYHQAQRWPASAGGDPLVVAEREGLVRINPNRIQAAVSKLGPRAEVGSEALAAEVLDDVWEELREGAFVARLSRDERALLRAVLVEAAQALVG